MKARCIPRDRLYQPLGYFPSFVTGMRSGYQRPAAATASICKSGIDSVPVRIISLLPTSYQDTALPASRLPVFLTVVLPLTTEDKMCSHSDRHDVGHSLKEGCWLSLRKAYNDYRRSTTMHGDKKIKSTKFEISMICRSCITNHFYVL